MYKVRPLRRAFRKLPLFVYGQERDRDEQPSKVDKKLKRAVSFPQIASPVVGVIAVALAGWGYVTTVLPVIQYQQLKEQAAKLEIDNPEATQTLAEARR
jgi:hypothetical protein